MATETQSVSPSYQKFLQAARAQSGDGHPSPPSTPSPSGNSGAGDGNSGSSGGTGGGGKSGGGGNHSSPKPTPHEGSATKKALLVVLILGAVCTSIIALSSVFIATRSTSPEGMAQTLQLSSLADKEDARKHERKMKELDIKQARLQGRTSNAISTATIPPASCQTISTSGAKKRAEAITLSYGQCVEFVASSTDRWFWVVLSSTPARIEGKASFGHLRDETEADKTSRRLRCIADTNDSQFCDKEMNIPRGVRVDDCVTKFTQDNCLGYLQGKPRTLPLLVNTDERIRINM